MDREARGWIQTPGRVAARMIAELTGRLSQFEEEFCQLSAAVEASQTELSHVRVAPVGPPAVMVGGFLLRIRR
jgi:hypothetical protein